MGAALGGMVGMAGALGYGFKLMVDVVGRQLSVQNTVIEGLETGIKASLDKHIVDCDECRRRDTREAAAAVKASAEAAANAVLAAAKAAKESGGL
jgi:hypothetical protein